MVDQHYNALAKRRKIEALRAESEALAFKRRLAKIRAQSRPTTVISIDAVIGVGPGELSAKWLRAQLPSDGRDIVLQVHSEGGLVFETMGMIDVLRAYPGRVKAVVSSMALSCASLLICGGCDEIEVTKNAYLMLHDAHMGTDDLSDSDNQLISSLVTDMADIYAARSRKPVHEIRRLMQAETWFNASDAVRHGFADRIVDSNSLRIVARSLPKKIVAQRQAAALGRTATARWKAAVARAGNSVTLADRQNPGLREKMLREVNAR